MKNRFRFTLFVLIAFCVLPARAAEQRYIVRAPGGLGLVQNICRLLGCSVLGSVADPKSELFIVGATVNNASNVLQSLLSLLPLTRQLGITNFELDRLIKIVPTKQPRTADTRTTLLDGSPVWTGYAAQPASKIIRLQEGQTKFGAYGMGIVALIDTGVDASHPALRYAMTPGYDFTAEQPSAGAANAPVARPNNFDSTAAVVDNPDASFGHGTMVAGIIHLVAPRAKIMSLKAFRADGTAYLSDVLSSIYYATRSGARVINMSFSMASSSTELKAALDYAVNRQLICVASAGNDGRETIVYPAGFDNTIGVASTNLNDNRSSFSNYGDTLVWVAAPGEEIITTYPSGRYAAGWGTSFSVPFVSGAAALIVDLKPGSDQSTAQTATGKATPAGRGMGNGRLDVFRALEATKFSH